MPSLADIEPILRLSPVMPVVVIEESALAPELARALLRGGLRVIEVTLRTPAALGAIEAIAREVPDIAVGAGTVLSVEDLRAAANAGHTAAQRRGRLSSLQQREQPLVCGGIEFAELGQHRAVDADLPGALHPGVQSRDVREADEWFCRRRDALQSGQQPHGAVATAGTEHCLDSGIFERAGQFGQPARIVAGQIALPGKNSGLEMHRVARGKHREARFERVPLERSGRRHGRNARTGTQRRKGLICSMGHGGAHCPPAAQSTPAAFLNPTLTSGALRCAATGAPDAAPAEALPWRTLNRS